MSDRLSQATVLARAGWTKRAIERFLGEPDATAPNPHYRRAGAPMRLYALARVEAVEATPEWAAWVERSANRRLAAQRAAVTRETRDTERMIAIVDGARAAGRLTPPRVSFDRVRDEASAYLEQRSEARGFFDDRRAVMAHDIENQIRHRYTQYDSIRRELGLHPTSESAARAAAYQHLSTVVAEEIVTVYPELVEFGAVWSGCA